MVATHETADLIYRHNASMLSYANYAAAVRRLVQVRELLPVGMRVSDSQILMFYNLQVPVDSAVYQIASGGC